MSYKHWATEQPIEPSTVTGYDGLVHYVRTGGYCLCGMGRSKEPFYERESLQMVTCLECITRRIDGARIVADEGHVYYPV